MSQKQEHETDHLQDRPMLSRWQTVVEEKIAAAREQGDFDDLPGHGEPLRLKENPLAGDWELAFHVLENAEMAPPWMEMSREIKQGEAELADLIARTNGYLAEQMERAPVHTSEQPPRDRKSEPWWWPFRRRSPPPLIAPARPDVAALDAERNRARREYLERAARLDEMLAAYNAWLPENLRRLQKPRLPASRAAERFDAACPSPVTRHPAWEEDGKCAALAQPGIDGDLAPVSLDQHS